MPPHLWSRALCGLSKLHSHSPEVTNLLFALAEKMGQCGTDTEAAQTPTHTQTQISYPSSSSSSGVLFTPLHLSQAMYGLRFMDSQHPAVRLVVRNLSAAVEVRGLQGVREREREVSERERERGVREREREAVMHGGVRNVNIVGSVDHLSLCIT